MTARALRALMVVALSMVFAAGLPRAALAQDSGSTNPTGTTEQNDSNNDEATSRATSTEVIVSTQTAARDHPVHSASVRPCAEWAPPPPVVIVPGAEDDPATEGTESAGEAGPEETSGDDPPADDSGWEHPFFNPDLYDDPSLWDTPPVSAPAPTSDPDCLVEYYCGGERIDEMFTGEISGEVPQAYNDYITFIGRLIDLIIIWGDGPDPTTVEGFTQLSDWVLEAGLGPRPSILFMPVFYFCRVGEGGPLEISEEPYTPSLGWDTDVVTEYDIITIRTELVREAEATLKAEEPELQAIPPLEEGITYVKFPMWFWLDDPIEELIIEAYSTPATVRVAIKATFSHIEWDLGDETLTCTLDEMREYPGEGATENVPDCSHAFQELVDFELTGEVFYDVEEQISFRGAVALPWPDPPFVTHPTDDVISTEQSAGLISVRQLLSLNVNEVE